MSMAINRPDHSIFPTKLTDRRIASLLRMDHADWMSVTNPE
jgi:hypothetical protein